MAEATQLHIISSCSKEGANDDFYEKIEAPKFFDFKKPERRRKDEDRYWFCSRVGCDLKHEEEIDYEAIEKDFVLRVMAARSPNVGFQKMLSKRSQSSNMKCPRTAPPKSSKLRVSKLAVISSISKKLDDTKVKAVPKSSKTPKAEVTQSSNVTKALTTPRNKKKLSNDGQFRSVRHPKSRTLTISKNRVVSKTLVFHSPKKAEQMRTELESNRPVSSLSSEMKKLKITNGKSHLAGCNSKPIDTARKELKGREVKSRVFTSVYSKNYKSKETKASSVNKETPRTAKHAEGPLSPYRAESNHSDMEIYDKTRNGSLGESALSDTSRTNVQGKPDNCSVNQNFQCILEPASSIRGMDHQSNSHNEEPRETEAPDPQVPTDYSEQINKAKAQEVRTCILEGELQKINVKADKENFPAFDGKENNGGLSEYEDINDTALDDNRKQNLSNKRPNKKVFGKHEGSKTPKKVSSVLNKNSEKSAVSGGTQRVKFYKPKPTNPKPFRFRTDERGILKEANLEKKLHKVEPLKKQESEGVICSEASNELQENCSRKIPRQVCTPKKSNGILHSKGTPEKTRSPTNNHSILKSRSVVSTEVSILTPGKLSVIPELTTLEPEHTAKTSEDNDFEMKKSSVSKSTREQRKPATIPKEPIFQRLHTRKSCTRNVA